MCCRQSRHGALVAWNTSAGGGLGGLFTERIRSGGAWRRGASLSVADRVIAGIPSETPPRQVFAPEGRAQGADARGYYPLPSGLPPARLDWLDLLSEAKMFQVSGWQAAPGRGPSWRVALRFARAWLRHCDSTLACSCRAVRLCVEGVRRRGWREGEARRGQPLSRGGVLSISPFLLHSFSFLPPPSRCAVMPSQRSSATISLITRRRGAQGLRGCAWWRLVMPQAAKHLDRPRVRGFGLYLLPARLRRHPHHLSA